MEKNQKTITICSSCSNCPTLTLNQNGVILKDDFGGTVKLNKEEFEYLKGLIKKEKV